MDNIYKDIEPIINFKTESEELEVEYEILPIFNIDSSNDFKNNEINSKIKDIDDEIAKNQEIIDKLNADIDKLTSHADGWDCLVATCSGILAGIVDVAFVGEFSIDRANEWGNEKVKKFVISIAKSQGYNGDDLAGAVEYLESKKKHKNNCKSGFGLASDSVTNEFGGGTQHHLRDFAHHPTLVGLIFSLLTQFTKKAYGTDTSGVFKVVDITNMTYIGKDIPQKILFGTVYWFFHMISDIAGSSGTISDGKVGTGLPGPLVSFLKEISCLPIFKKVNEDGNKELSVWISKLFNGTLLAKRDEKGKIIESVKFDLRTEIGVAHELGKQSLPVLLNECIVRGFYFIRRIVVEIKNKKISSFSNLKLINPSDVLPFNNRTIVRMMTIATSTFTAVDLADAAIRGAVNSGGTPAGFASQFVLRVNFVGVGRCAIACGTDIAMGVKRSKLRDERIAVCCEQLYLLNAKTFYKQANMWIAAKDAEESMEEAKYMMNEAIIIFNEAFQDIDGDLKKIKGYVPLIEEKNPGLIDDINDILIWG